MSKQINIDEESYKKFQAALILTGEDEETVLCKLISMYFNKAFERVVGKIETATPDNDSRNSVADITEEEQKRLFVNWFRGLIWNGKPYNPVTVSGYTGRIENACSDPIFASVPVNNLFTITDLSEFIGIQKQIKSCAGYNEFDAKSHNGFTAALRKYEEFLRFQAGGQSISSGAYTSVQSYSQPSGVHRWTMEEDEICCRRFLECYVIKRSNMAVEEFLQMLAKEVPAVSKGSLRMKIQNVKYLSELAKLNDTAVLKRLSQYSRQSKIAFSKVSRELGLQL